MLKVMIVEDEDIVRDDIKRLIDWEKHGYTITAEARNGSEGLQLASAHNPDIIITDIKMPVMGGLEMIRNLLQSTHQKKFILLTSYADFDFARKAISMGIRSYVLKHELDPAVLIRELDSVKQEMAKAQRLEYLARTEWLRSLLEGKEVPGRDAETNGSLLFRWKRRTGMVIFGFDGAGKEEIDKTEFINFVYSQLFRDEAEMADLPGDQYVVVFRFPEQYSERKNNEYAREFARKLQSEIYGRFGRTVTIAIGPAFEHYSDIGACLKRTKDIFALKVFQKGNSLLEESPALVSFRDASAAASRSLRLIEETLDKQDFELAEAYIDDFLTRQLSLWRQPRLLQDSISALLRPIAALARDFDPEAEAASIGGLENVYVMSERLKEIIGKRKDVPGEKYGRKMAELLKFIKEHYYEEITLAHVADRLDVSLIYASQLFKKEVGVSFMTYVTKCRIDNAKRLLQSGDYKVYEVCEKVGYQTVPYFSKMFKKVTGKNPSDYMN